MLIERVVRAPIIFVNVKLIYLQSAIWGFM